ncbi:hypothetical protein A2372_02635 [Candidatus Wolfebacteria bacterium RIFOXYB1_FULL_54_12]|uniref:Peptidase M3A/M3B catalytic domain-containing protein n=1 Tax=Candidatus Wolfebacteria bacterium RIFOXYB1_FULL_54_12 TaxID=1802559 RepID=A0A1F8DXK7_9BACT|nr:MAG: hypothetical protein A2372_02635 [Candidatus Wolfebacteria bacterium RIFOXYB1_FULL_54_12]
MNRKNYTPEDFAWVSWTPEIIAQKIQEAIEAKKARYATIKAIAPEARTFENTIVAIESSSYDHDDAMGAIGFLTHVSPTKEVRDAAQSAIEELQKAMIDIEYDEAMYRAVQEYAAKNEQLKGADAQLFADTMRAYKRMGFALETEKQKQLKDNLKETAELASGFEKAIADHADRILVRREELRGLPEAYINGLKRDEEGNYIVTLAYPDYIPFCERCDSAPRRKELMDKFNRRGGVANMERLRRILELRAENAVLLGYPHHAAFKLEDRMAKTVDAVNAFYDDLRTAVGNSAKFDLQLLAAMKQKDLGDPSARLAYYDIGYYIQQDKMNGYAVDDEAIREYLPLEAVKATMFDLYSTVLGLSFSVEQFPAWHESVQWYRVNNTDGSLVGYFALDLFPREGKYGHAMMQPIVQGRMVSRDPQSVYATPTCAVVANFNPPAGDTPALLSHGEVQTLFHEFGHAIHTLVTVAPYASQAGTSTARDFVEAPSQMFEYWVWEKDLLKKMSKHHATGEPLPDDLIDRIIRAKNHAQGYSVLRQLFLGTFDMAMHTTVEPVDPVQVYADLYKKTFELDSSSDQLWAAGFGHLMGYDAGYYGYLWSEVYAADMFARFRAEGVLDPKVGMDYRKKILEVGSSRDEIESVKDFLGRVPNNKAFLQDMGLATRDEHGEAAGE